MLNACNIARNADQGYKALAFVLCYGLPTNMRGQLFIFLTKTVFFSIRGLKNDLPFEVNRFWTASSVPLHLNRFDALIQSEGIGWSTANIETKEVEMKEIPLKLSKSCKSQSQSNEMSLPNLLDWHNNPIPKYKDKEDLLIFFYWIKWFTIEARKGRPTQSFFLLLFCNLFPCK